MKRLRYILFCLSLICGQSVQAFIGTSLYQEACKMRAMASALIGSSYHRSYLGSEPASEKIQQMAREIMDTMGIENPDDIAIMYLSDAGFDEWGVENLIATSNTIFIDGSWFNSLSGQEQRFLLAHELAHIKNKDNQMTLATITLVCAAWGYQLHKCLQNDASLASLVGLSAGCALLLPAYSRMQEQRADLDGARALQSVAGGLICTKKWLQEGRGSTDIFATHPGNLQRIEALELLGQELASS